MAKFVGTSGNNVLQGGAAADTMYGYSGDDLLIGDAGIDHLFGGKGNDGFFGGGGNDVIYGNSGNDTVFGDGGNDILYGGTGNDTLYGGADDDLLYGGKGNDILDGGTGNNQLYGGSGDDLLIAGNGNNLYNGGSGIDTVDFSHLAGRLDIDLGSHVARIMDPSSNTVMATSKVFSVEHVIGTSGDDNFKGTAGDNIFEGGSGNDTFRGMAGADTFTGGQGADTFTWLKKDVTDGLMDHVADFEKGVDKLDMFDFLKGQGIKNAQYSDVIHIEDAADHSGAVIKALAGGHWVSVVELDHVDAATLTLHDLGL